MPASARLLVLGWADAQSALLDVQLDGDSVMVEQMHALTPTRRVDRLYHMALGSSDETYIECQPEGGEPLWAYTPADLASVRAVCAWNRATLDFIAATFPSHPVVVVWT